MEVVEDERQDKVEKREVAMVTKDSCSDRKFYVAIVVVGTETHRCDKIV